MSTDQPDDAGNNEASPNDPRGSGEDVIAEAEQILTDAAASVNDGSAGSAGATGLTGLTADEAARITAQRDEYLDSLQRLQADFDNYRKRVQRDQEMAADRASEKLIEAMVPVLDTFELALSHEADPDASPLARMHDQLLSALEAQGLERLAPLGLAFDPNDAEAVMTEPAEDGDAGPVVSAVLRAGYRWRGRVMRAAMVKVKG